MINGVIVVKKEKGMTSFGVVARLRRIFDQKKIGHTGTLDPDAEGVLPVCFGRATRLVETLSKGTKTYEAVMLLGQTTDTQDTTGQVLSEAQWPESREEIEAAIRSFEGKQQQLPPMYSALKVNGQKLVDLARRGIEVERKPREVEFSELEVLWIDPPRAAFRVTCTHGAYIRTLCHDIGQKLGCGACMESLLRTRVGEFDLQEARTLQELEEQKKAEDAASGAAPALYSFVLPVDSFYAELQAVTVRAEDLVSVLNGNPIPAQPEDPIRKSEEVRAYTEDGTFIGIYKKERKLYRLVKYYYEDHQSS
ncbi:MAG: tRNA pseudouridine(55) synthase TruB [Lachnospiraceae bacterium]|nr:tRNA pseudouridine(55) synthase TruB [Lachnospiraceae bacterium]